MSDAPRHILVIGMGAGDPDHLTLAAVKAMRRADVFFVLGKGREKDALTRLRRDILGEHLTGPYRVVEAEDPWRDRTQQDGGRYASAVHDWRHRRADICERLIIEELAPGQCGAFLVWGDPSLYDSTLAILDDIRGRGTVEFGYEVIPGISSVSALAARHRVTLNRVGHPIHITPGRRLAQGFPEDCDLVVMLDGHESFTHLTGRGWWIHWGAYIGTPDEILVSGPLDEVAGRISRLRAEARERHGWIMDTYLLRRGPGDAEDTDAEDTAAGAGRTGGAGDAGRTHR
ncbi:precorrin-6A synthase (deacetylating) [Streptomyces anulatus]|uniref:precorrin-6A synthase (deacetylating) n=1 Tax=Streptomyces anulatus TaxID=1892 RepID=UPI003423DF23